MRKLLILLFIGFATVASRGQGEGSISELCIGSGVHCAVLNYGNIKMTFVKSANAPGIRIREEKETKKES